MKDLPLVSIITPTYNRAHTLGACIQSVLGQSYTNFELLIIDDGSEDDTVALIQQFEDTRIQYYPIAHVGNLSYLRNFGLARSQGEFIAFIDSDDIWEANKLETQMNQLAQDPTCRWAFSDLIEFNEEHTILRDGIYQRLQREDGAYIGLFDDLIHSKLIIFPSCLLMKKSLLNQVTSFNEALSVSDSAFMIRLAEISPAYFSNDKLVKIRKHEGNISNFFMCQESGHLEIIESLEYAHQKKRIDNHIYKQRMTMMYYGLGKVYMHAAQKEKALNAFNQALVFSFPFSKMWLKINILKAKSLFYGRR